MPTDYERLAVLLEARVSDFEKRIAGATRNADRNFKRIEKSAISMRDRVSGAAGGMATRLAGAFAAAASAGAAVKLIDSAKQIENALKVTGLQGEALTEVYDDLFAAAQKNAAPVESLTTLYSKLALTQKELGVSQQELIGFTDKVALALRVGGTDAVAASGALLQLSQALGGGTVRAEEFNSVLEGAPTIMQAAAAGLKEAGGSVAQLRKLVVDGKVSSQAFFRAFEAGSVVLEQKVAGAELTVSQQMVRLQNVLIDTAGKIDRATDASGRLGKGIESLADVVRGFGQVIAETADSDLGKLLGWFDNAIDKADQFRKVMGGIPGIISKLSSVNQDILNGREIGTGLNEKNIQNRIEAAFEGTGAASKTGRLPANPKVETVTLNDYPLDKTGSGKGAKERADEYQREIAQIRERTASLTAAYAAQAALNPLINDYGYAVEKARAKQELLTAAQKAGKQITPELSAEIDAAAEAYARAGAEAEKLAEKQDLIRQSAEDVMATAKDVTRGMIDGFIEGEKAADIFANSLKKIGNALIDDVLNSIFQVQNASSGGGLFGGLFGNLFGGGGGFNPAGKVGLFASGGYTGPGGKNQPAGIVHKGEVVFSQADVARMGGVTAVEALRRGYANGGPVGVRAPVMPKLASQGGGGGVTVTIPINIDATGADAAGLARVQQEVAMLRSELPARAVQAIQNAKKRNVGGL